MKPAIEVFDLTAAYKYKPVLWDIDLTIPEGVLMAIIGPNGAGKSTLLKAMLGIVKPVAGTVKFFGFSYMENRKLVAYVPQKGSVDWDFPTTVLDVVMMGSYGRLGLFNRPGKKEKRQAYEAIEKVGLIDFTRRQISQLSGGQQQRVFLARALMQDAEIFLLDEPFQGVDVTTEKSIIKILKDLRSQGKTVIVVHHDLQTVESYFDWVALLNIRLIASGPVKDIFNPSNLEKTYGGSIRLFPESEFKIQ